MILLGYRGSGKTTIGRRLAESTNRPFVDTDDLIVARANRTIREIFEQEGEAYFRDLESLVLHEVCGHEVSGHEVWGRAAIIALGGGAILREENRTHLAASPHRRIYLRCSPEKLHDHIRADPRTAAGRPSLTHLGGGIDEIRALLLIREPMYRAVMTEELDVTDLSVDAAAVRLQQSERFF